MGGGGKIPYVWHTSKERTRCSQFCSQVPQGSLVPRRWLVRPAGQLEGQHRNHGRFRDRCHCRRLQHQCRPRAPRQDARAWPILPQPIVSPHHYPRRFTHTNHGVFLKQLEPTDPRTREAAGREPVIGRLPQFGLEPEEDIQRDGTISYCVFTIISSLPVAVRQ